MKPSEIFEGENSSLRKTFDEAISDKNCSREDDMFARTNEGYGYMQCQTHLRDSAKCVSETNYMQKGITSEISTYKESLRSKIASADIAEDKVGTFQDGYRCFKAQVLALFENKDHTCCDGECNHDDCCGKVPENCPLLDANK